MFGDRMSMGDSAMLKLSCAHIYTAAEMKCLNCGAFYQSEQNKMQTGQSGDLEFTSVEVSWL